MGPGGCRVVRRFGANESSRSRTARAAQQVLLPGPPRLHRGKRRGGHRGQEVTPMMPALPGRQSMKLLTPLTAATLAGAVPPRIANRLMARDLRRNCLATRYLVANSMSSRVLPSLSEATGSPRARRSSRPRVVGCVRRGNTRAASQVIQSPRTHPRRRLDNAA